MKIGKTPYTSQSTSRLAAATPKNTQYNDDLMERSKELAGLGIKPAEDGQTLKAGKFTGFGDSIVSQINELY